MKYATLLILLVPYSVDAKVIDYSKILRALRQASQTTQVPYRLIAAVCFIESSYRPLVVSKYDGDSPSYGLCQIKAMTAADMGFEGAPDELLNPFVNALYAAKYLKFQLERYDGDWVRALSAYNRGNSRSKIVNQEYVTKVLTLAVTL